VALANYDDRRLLRTWLISCADPLGDTPGNLPSPEITRRLIEQADRHGVLPALLAKPVIDRLEFRDVRPDAMLRKRAASVLSLMLRAHGEAIIADASRLPAILVKGPVFARTIYPRPALRGFTDIDILIAPEAEPDLATILTRHGFRPAAYERDPVRQEWKWLHRENEALMIEVHTNLVHHPQLRASFSLTYDLIAGAAEAPSTLLAIALTHGALHRFDRLRQLVDICQAARYIESSDEKDRFVAVMDRIGARFAGIAGLELAHRLWREPRCLELSHALGRARHIGLARRLLTPSVVTSTMDPSRWRSSWRRQGFRFLLKRSRRFDRAKAGANPSTSA
jgi:hypothetical protein